MPPRLTSELRRLRSERGLSQARLAELAGITRQSYAAIESGRSVPSTEVALRLGRALDIAVEDLFRLPEEIPDTIRVFDARLDPSNAASGGSTSGRVRLARVGDRTVAFGLESGGVHAGVPADAIVLGSPDGSTTTVDRLRVRTLRDRRPSPDLVVAGCDPAFGLVARELGERGFDVLWIPAGSEAALGGLSRGVVHVAGIHLRDPDTGAYNEPSVRRLVDIPTIRVRFAVWEQALVSAPGNPLGIVGVKDLARPEVRLLNREAGSGARALLDVHLREAGLDPSSVRGYRETAARGHHEVVAGVAAGAADVGVAIRATATARGLTAVTLSEEPYELVIPDRFLAAPAIDALLAVLRTPRLRRQVEALGGYDAAAMGRVA